MFHRTVRRLHLLELPPPPPPLLPPPGTCRRCTCLNLDAAAASRTPWPLPPRTAGIFHPTPDNILPVRCMRCGQRAACLRSAHVAAAVVPPPLASAAAQPPPAVAYMPRQRCPTMRTWRGARSWRSELPLCSVARGGRGAWRSGSRGLPGAWKCLGLLYRELVRCMQAKPGATSLAAALRRRHVAAGWLGPFAFLVVGFVKV